ncbi:hypothetical protein AK812_SmicGene26549 [Symbiodinium microadriaticum]|uniref:Uncharacterized protein n=1 Tax=Symbiodinium microadriaticum TaxID=2951 RepID=A0A1Q9D990_SYMMI|nr:hypothetical protein AK812_SmicGene26549 [Symbiodinium microadriaticum]
MIADSTASKFTDLSAPQTPVLNLVGLRVKAVLERDLMKMKGFWPMSPEDIPISESCKVPSVALGLN